MIKREFGYLYAMLCRNRECKLLCVTAYPLIVEINNKQLHKVIYILKNDSRVCFLLSFKRQKISVCAGLALGTV